MAKEKPKKEQEDSEKSDLEEIVEEESEDDEDSEDEGSILQNQFSFSDEDINLKNQSSENVSLALEKINDSFSGLESGLTLAPRLPVGKNMQTKDYDPNYDINYDNPKYDEKTPDYSTALSGGGEKAGLGRGSQDSTNTDKQ